VSWIGRPQLLLEQQKNLWALESLDNSVRNFGGGGSVGCRSGLQAGDPLQSFIRNGAAQTQVTQESRQRQHDRQKVGAGRDSVEAYDYLCIGVVELAELMQGEEAWRCGLV
jgi:hypothetical protein